MKSLNILTVMTAMFLLLAETRAATTRPRRKATFEARDELKVTIPEGAQQVRIWFAMPQDDPNQTVRDFKVDVPAAHKITRDSEGNKTVYLDLQKANAREITLVETFTISRREQISGASAAKAKPLSAADRERLGKYLQPNQNVVIDDEIRKLASEIVGGEQNPVAAARKIYDWVLANIDYWVKDPKNKKASPVGSTEYCLKTRTGNCTDFHSLWTSLARASGIPTRMVYGSFFKAELDGQDADQSYHCWPEFYASAIGWVPHDVAVADIFAGDFQTNADNEKLVRLTTGDGYRGPDKEKVEYYFGNIDERRVVWSRGRDLILEPKQAGGPVNALPKAYIEVDGKPLAEKTGWNRKLTFKEIK